MKVFSNCKIIFFIIYKDTLVTICISIKFNNSDLVEHLIDWSDDPRCQCVSDTKNVANYYYIDNKVADFSVILFVSIIHDEMRKDNLK